MPLLVLPREPQKKSLPRINEAGSVFTWLPKCASTRTRPGRIEPEVWFRIVHSVQDSHSVAPVAAYREQSVEIALGPKGTFENGNIGVLRRWVPTDQVISAVLPRQGIRKPPKKPRTPRVVELLRKAIEWKDLLESGQIATQADIACQEGITRARVTQVMGLLRLAPEFQEQILTMSKTIRKPEITERRLRPTISGTERVRHVEPIVSLMF